MIYNKSYCIQMKKNILVTGANGQLGNEIRLSLVANCEFNAFFTDIAELDITNRLAVFQFLTAHKIDIIINCAAYTAVDMAEDDFDNCNKINHIAVANLAEAAASVNARMIHISTDYVFDGKKGLPYNETDTPNPQTAYGKTKYAGEQELKKFLPKSHVIIRTAWLYSTTGKNFVKTMLSLGKTKDSINVVADQIGTPTYAGDLAQVILHIIKTNDNIHGTFHFSNEGACSWYDFTKMIHKIAYINSCKVYPISTQEYPTKAKRPTYSVLDKQKIKKTFNLEIPYWIDSLEKCIEKLSQKNNN